MNTMNNVYRDRLATVQAKLKKWQVDGLVVGSPSNRLWLTGFTGSAGWLLISSDSAILATDSRYWTQAARQSPDYETAPLKGDREKAVLDLIVSSGLARIGFESDFITVRQFDLMQAIPDVNWVKLSGAIRPLRAVKTAEEIELISAAAAITDKVMAQVPSRIIPGKSERALAWELEREMREAGASGLAFPIIVASGPNGALPHHAPTDRNFQEGDAIIVDMGAKVGGYCSDLTRSFYLGSPDEKFLKIYNVVFEAQGAVIDQLSARMPGNEVDAIARNIIEAAGYGEAFGHSLGHGLGLDVHESPGLSYLVKDTKLPAGSVVTIEPGIYEPGWGGVRIEDLTLVTESGNDLISQCLKSPTIPIS